MNAAASLSEEQIVASVIKARRAEQFHKDSGLELLIIQAIGQAVHTVQADGKKFTHLLLYIETNLKAARLCFSPDSEPPEEAYRCVRKMGHRVKSLAEDLESFRPNWVQGLHPNALAILDEAQRFGMDERYFSPSSYKWFKPERQEFYTSFAHLATKIHTAAESEVERCFQKAPIPPPHLRAKIDARLSAMT
jgi:hypothetical protein